MVHGFDGLLLIFADHPWRSVAIRQIRVPTLLAPLLTRSLLRRAPGLLGVRRQAPVDFAATAEVPFRFVQLIESQISDAAPGQRRHKTRIELQRLIEIRQRARKFASVEPDSGAVVPHSRYFRIEF